MVWDAFKAVMRGHFISVASAHKKAKVVSDIKANIAFLEAKRYQVWRQEVLAQT